MKMPVKMLLGLGWLAGVATIGALVVVPPIASAASLVDQSSEPAPARNGDGAARKGFTLAPKAADGEPIEHPGVHLTGQVTVTDSLVRLGDLFEGLEQDADKPVARAPEPGGRLIYEARALAAIAAKNRVPWTPQTRFDRVVVIRDALRIGRELIEAEVARELTARSDQRDFDIQLDNPSVHFDLPTDKHPMVVVETLNHDPRSGRFVAVVAAPAGDPEAERIRITGRAVEATEVPVPLRQIQAGDVIAEKDIEWIRTPADRMSRGIALTLDQLVGYEARRPLNAGEPIRASDIQPKVMITKGGIVSMILVTPKMTLTALGKAMEDGSMGETIQVRNSNSNRSVNARVTGPDTVSVLPVSSIAQR